MYNLCVMQLADAMRWIIKQMKKTLRECGWPQNWPGAERTVGELVSAALNACAIFSKIARADGDVFEDAFGLFVEKGIEHKVQQFMIETIVPEVEDYVQENHTRCRAPSVAAAGVGGSAVGAVGVLRSRQLDDANSTTPTSTSRGRRHPFSKPCGEV